MKSWRLPSRNWLRFIAQQFSVRRKRNFFFFLITNFNCLLFSSKQFEEAIATDDGCILSKKKLHGKTFAEENKSFQWILFCVASTKERRSCCSGNKLSYHSCGHQNCVNPIHLELRKGGEGGMLKANLKVKDDMDLKTLLKKFDELFPGEAAKILVNVAIDIFSKVVNTHRFGSCITLHHFNVLVAKIWEFWNNIFQLGLVTSMFRQKNWK